MCMFWQKKEMACDGWIELSELSILYTIINLALWELGSSAMG